MTEATHEAPPATPLNGLMLMAAMVSAISGALYGHDTGIISGAAGDLQGVPQRAPAGLRRDGAFGG